ncbi:MAG TPA: class I SAM-dependent methyltransferase [Pyrinomonadaceae bacterium]
MTDSGSELVENLLARPDVHEQWEGHYRTAENERFYEAAFDYIARVLAPPPGATFLDVGCGPCAHSLRLARRGFNVRAVDFSESALEMARSNVRASGMEERITLQRESLLGLSFPDESFDYVLCWGVLMHIPEVGRAVRELSRVVKPGGALVVSEGNTNSWEAVALRALKRLMGRERAEVKRAEAGTEYWKVGDGEALVTRQADVGWLERSFAAEGFRLERRAAGQFSEAYAMVGAPALRRLVHGFNDLWFKHVGFARPAYGNILFFRKAK